MKKKAAGYFGKLWLEKGMPVIRFDTLKTSSLEGSAETVYAQGGRGNPRLVAWEGDRTVTFTMEDALISPESFSILSGAGFLDAASTQVLYVHTVQQVEVRDDNLTVRLEKEPAKTTEHAEAVMYAMLLDENGNIDSKYVPLQVTTDTWTDAQDVNDPGYNGTLEFAEVNAKNKNYDFSAAKDAANANVLHKGSILLVDYYVKAETGVKQIEIEAGKFGGSYYLEASTLFRDSGTGKDYPAEFVIPNCKVQSNFTFTMAPTGDPSTFSFTMDAFPDYTKFDHTKKVIAAMQIIEDDDLGAPSSKKGE